MKKIINWVKEKYYAWKVRRQIKEMKDKDPFIYK